MTPPASDQIAPPWLPRRQRRHIGRQLHRLMRRDVCSLCGGKLKHNSRTAGGLDAQGNVVLAGECCIGRVAITITQGLYSDRQYHCSWPCSAQSGSPTYEQIAEAVLDDIARWGGDLRTLRDPPWTSDDHDWFERNQERSHRLRLPFPGERDEEVAKAPTGHALIVLVRQVEPGMRLESAVSLNADLLPLPDDEAAAHALFEVAVRHEPVPRNGEAFDTLIRKYTIARESHQ
jgi:hypothetical protein